MKYAEDFGFSTKLWVFSSFIVHMYVYVVRSCLGNKRSPTQFPS